MVKITVYQNHDQQFVGFDCLGHAEYSDENDIVCAAVSAMTINCINSIETFTETFDTILMLMNGSGIIGRPSNMPDFFRRMKRILRPGGCILMDSSDLRYLFEEEDGSIVIDLAGDYYGEIDFRMQYKSIKGDTFDWLYIDFQTLSLYASECGFKAELVKEGKHYDYLAKLSIV